MGRKKKTTAKHVPHILLLATILVVFGMTLVFMHWYGKPLQQIRAERTFDSLVDRFKYGHVKGEKLSDSQAQEVPILLYHGILDGPDDGFSISKNTFIDQMVQLKKAGYTTITSQEYLSFISGKTKLPEKSIMITFDDGRKDSFYRADPILKALAFKAVMYLTSGYSIVDGSKYYVDRGELKAMQATGRWDIEAHADYAGTNQIVVDKKGTKENFFGYLKWLPEKDRRENLTEYRQRVSIELATVKTRLQNLLGQNSIMTLAFPFGDYAQHHKDKALSKILLAEAAKYYKQVYVQFRPGEPYSSNYFGDDNFISRRIEVKPSLSGSDLVLKLAQSIAKPSKFSAAMTTSDGWKKEWGILALNNHRLTLSSEQGSTTAAAYLDGTKKLKNYTASIRIEHFAAESTNIELAGGYIDKNNYMGCVFYPNKIVSEAVADGRHYKIAETVMQQGYRSSSTLSTTLDANEGIACKTDGVTQLSSAWDLSDTSGGPAIFVRDASRGVASVTLEKFEYTSRKIPNQPAAPPAPAKKITYASVDFNNYKHWVTASNIILNSNDKNFTLDTSSSGKKRYLRATLKEGSYSALSDNLGRSATIFKIPLNTANMGPATEAYLQYNVMFERGFDFGKAGVLPGLGGGKDNTNGMVPNGYDGWSSRLMWNGNKLGNYAYFPGADTYGQQYPGNMRNDISQLAAGRWQCVALHIKLNDRNKKNGMTEVWLNNKKVLLVNNMLFRYGNNLKIDDILFEVFFGGRNNTFASPKTQSIYFDNVTVSNHKIACDQTSAPSQNSSNIFKL